MIKKIVLFALLLHSTFLIAQGPVLQRLQNHQGSTGVPGIALGIIDGGNLIQEYYLGTRIKDSLQLPIDSSTVFSSGSVSKLITTTAVLCLIRDGQIGLNDDASTILGYDINNPSHPNLDITVFDLLTHQSSIRDDSDTLNTYVNDCTTKPDLDTVVFNYLNVWGAKFNIGSFYITPPVQTKAYSNMNFVVLAAIVEKASGLSFEEYCTQEIFEPLCMNASFWWPGDIPDNRLAKPHSSINGSTSEIPLYCLDIFPAGQFSARLRDYLLFSRAYVKGSSPILSDSLIDIALNPYYFDQFTGVYQGLAWFNFNYGGQEWWGHNGSISGVNANFFWNWQSDQGIVLLENQDQPTDDLLFDLLDESSLFSGSGRSVSCGTLGSDAFVHSKSKAEIFPNPANDAIQLNLKQGTKLCIVNAQGTVVQNSILHNRGIDISQLGPGLYWVRTEANESFPFIKN